MLDGSLSSPLPPASLAGPDRGVWIVGSKRQTAQVLDRAFALRAHGVADRERGDQTPHAFAQLQREGRCCRPGQLVDVIDRRLTAVDEALGVLGLAHGRRSAAIGLAKLDGDHVILDLDGEHRRREQSCPRGGGLSAGSKPRVVIVSGGFGGLACARKLASELDEACCWIELSRHGSRFDPRTGRPLSLRETDERLDMVAVWREADCFGRAERSALAWCETLTLRRALAPLHVGAGRRAHAGAHAPHRREVEHSGRSR